MKIESKKISNEQVNQAKEEVKKYVESKYNLSSISRTITEIIDSNSLSSINKVYFYINDCSSDEYDVSCSYIYNLYEK